MQRTDKKITIYTGTKITLDKLRNTKIHILHSRNKKENHRDKQSKLGSKALLGQSTCGYNGKRVSGHANKKGGEE